MKKNKFRIFFILIIIIISLVSFLSFLWWNDTPPLPKKSNPPIIKIDIPVNKKDNSKPLKIASYNIHFGIGFDDKTKKTHKHYYLKRLEEIAKVLKEIDADVVLLQEVDFDSKRSSFIHQGKYLAKLAGYPYIAKAPTLRKKIHLSYNMLIGRIEHGLCILSRYPIDYNENIVFDQKNEIPFFAKWLFDPHGAQKCVVDFNGTKINIINLHLEPWSQYIRENQIKHIKNDWLLTTKLPTIIGGDFNALSPFAKKEGLYLQDAPWFIDKSKWNLKNEKTIPTILHAGFKDSDPTILSLTRIKNLTFPSINPKEKIDFIFAGNKAKILNGFVFKDAKEASDHLPIVAEIEIKAN